MIIIKSPAVIPDICRDKTKIFLAGSIEMGIAETWQESIAAKIDAAIKELSAPAVTTDQFVLLNPRRDDWDSSWGQTSDDPQFRQQVTWELSSLSAADWIIMYFDPATRSPISLLELGLHAGSKKLVVVCPNGFWRKGNVDIVCDFYQVPQRDSLENACTYIVEEESKKCKRP